MAEADYYTVLGINRTANEDDIKKAYRKMALQWHPDKNPDNKEEAERRFKVISEAYQVLSDANKRSAYDRYGKSGSAFASGGQFNFHFQSPADLFQQFFGGGDGLSFLFGHHGSSNGHFNMNGHRGYQSPPIRVFTFSPGSAGFPFQMEGTYFDNPFCNSPFHSGRSDEDDFYRDMGRLHSPYGSDAQKLCQSTVNTINGQKVVTTIEVDGLEETITVETDGVITSRTVNGVEQCASQNMHNPSFHRSTVPRTLRTRPTEGHSTDRLRYCGAHGSSGCSASSFPNSASNSFLFKDSKKRSTADSHTARPTSPPVVSSSVRLERKDAPASKEVPVRKESPAPKGVSVQKEVPTGKEAAELKEVPAVRKVVPAGLEVPEENEVPIRTEDLMQEKIPNGKEVGQHPDLQDRRDNDVPKSSGVPECRLVSDRNEVAETDGQRIYAESLSALSSKSNRKTLLYSRIACNSQIRILYEVKLL